ncbi:hypothetical protein ACJJIF_16350 [Microbulbifer sp. SSSA002]|uniref:hypothetical protein n=1 Tax=Microbulbifer sp. SSSA002 TaxID=3243376 RepID=UPI004039DE4F
MKLIIKRGEIPNIDRNVYVHPGHAGTWEQLKREHPGNYYKTNLVRALYSLAITPGSRNIGAKTLNLDGAQFHYQIHTNGDVLVYGLIIDSSISASVTNQASGLYRVNRDDVENKWKTDTERLKTMDYSHRWGSAHYAAVSGKFDNKEEAGELLINHILPAYKAALKPRDLEGSRKHYSLYWQNGQHQKPDNAQSLAALIQQAQANDASINWLVHGEGAGTFVQALQSLAKQPGISSLVANGKTLSNQSVFFSNPRGKNTRKEDLEKFCEAAGMYLVDVNVNQYDLKNADSRNSVLKAARTPIILAAACGIDNATGWADLELAVSNGMSAPSMIKLAAYGIGVCWLAIEVFSKNSGYARNLKGVASNTLGSGNKHWAA